MIYSDQQLIANYLTGNEEALETLIKRYLKSVYNFTYRYTGNQEESEDITQKVFVKVWRNLRKFDQSKNFKSWIFSIAKNTSIDWLRKKKAIPFSSFENEKGENVLIRVLADSAPLPDKLFERASIAETLNATINQLAPKYRRLFSLRYNGGLTFRKIAVILGKPVNTIKSQHRRALISLKKLLPANL